MDNEMVSCYFQKQYFSFSAILYLSNIKQNLRALQYSQHFKLRYTKSIIVKVDSRVFIYFVA